MRARVSLREFEERWQSLLIKFGLVDNTWLINLHLDKRMWAEAYLRDHFFAGITSTQRSELVNAKLHSYIHRGSSLMKMVEHYERWLTQVRTNEAHNACIIEQSSPFLTTTMRYVKSQAATSFTHKIFAFVQTEIKNCSTCVLSEMIYINKSLTKYKFGDYNNEGVIHTIDLSTNGDQLELFYDCYLMKSVGIPCKHMFVVLLPCHIKELPDSFILKRWTCVARVGINSGLLSSNNLHLKNQKRYIEMSKIGNELFYKASCSEESSQKVLKVIKEQLANLNGFEPLGEKQNQIRENGLNVKDPIPVTTKGRPRLRIKSGVEKRKKRCGLCHVLGHTCPTCPLLKKMDMCMESSRPQASVESLATIINPIESVLKGDANSNILSSQSF